MRLIQLPFGNCHLIITNVCFSILLVVCLTLCLSSPADAAPYSALYVFGGTLSDLGNWYVWAAQNASSDVAYLRMGQSPFLRGRLSDGKIYAEVLADLYGIPPLRPSSDGGTVYAWVHFSNMRAGQLPAGVNRRGLDNSIPGQVDRFVTGLGEAPADSSALYIIAIEGWTAGGAASLVATIQSLAARGASNILVMDPLSPYTPDRDPNLSYEPFVRRVPSWNMTPLEASWASEIEAYGRAEAAVNAALATVEGLNLMRFDTDFWLGVASRQFKYPRAPFLHRERYIPLPESHNPDDFIFLDYRPVQESSVEAYVPLCLTAAAHRSLALAVAEAVDRAPVATDTVPDVTLLVDGDRFRRDLNESPAVFFDEDGHSLRYSAFSSDSTVAVTEIQGIVLLVSPVGPGTAVVTVSADDTYKSGETAFTVTVQAFGYALSADLDAADGDQSTTSLSAVAPDWSCSVQVFLDDIQDATRFAASVEYDSEQLTYEGFDAGTLFPDVQAQPVVASTAIALTTDSMTIGTESTGGLLGTLRFRTSPTFSGTEVRLVAPTLLRNGRSETLDDAIIARLSATSCDFDTDGRVGFSDFLLFAGSFLATSTDTTYDPRLDLDADNDIDFTDFLLFAKDYGTKLATG